MLSVHPKVGIHSEYWLYAEYKRPKAIVPNSNAFPPNNSPQGVCGEV